MQAVEKAVRIIEALGTQPYIGVRKLSRLAGTSPAAAHRILKVFIQFSWVRRIAGPGNHPKYELTGRVSFTTLMGQEWPDEKPEMFHQAEQNSDSRTKSEDRLLETNRKNSDMSEKSRGKNGSRTGEAA